MADLKVDIPPSNDIGRGTSGGNGASPVFQSDRIKAMKKVDPVNIQWEHIKLDVPVKGKTKSVLIDLSGELKSGNITAIMGPTGCGKTSLLNCLAGRVQHISGASLTGRLLTNGVRRDQEEFKNMSAYVTQDDELYAQLTVSETLTLAANFSLGSSLPAVEKEAFVKSVIADLGLVKAKNTIIGDAQVKGVSGGERKRVSIGVELISNPSVLFLDEPTSGLDAFQALSVMTCMKQLAGTGRTIVAVIHQPRSSIFNMLDDLILLSEGRTVYLGAAADAHDWFKSQGFACPSNSSPADFFLDTISKDYRTHKLEKVSQQRINFLTEAYYKEQEKKKASAPAAPGGDGKKKAAEVCSPMNNLKAMMGRKQETYGAGWWTQLRYLLWRNFNVAARNKIGRVIGAMLPTIFGLLFGAIWSQRGTGQAGIQDKVGLLFMITINMAFMGMAETLQTFPIEKRTVQKERASGFYSLSAYYISKVVTYTPFSFIGPIIFSAIIYPLANFRHGPAHFFTFLGILLVEILNAGALGMFLSTLAPDPEIANAMAPAFNIIFTVFNGVLINVKDLPDGSAWVANIGHIRWAFEALAINEFRDRPYACDAGANSQTCITNGNQMLMLYNYDEAKIGYCVLWMIIIGLITHALAFFNLWRNATKYMKVHDKDAATNGGQQLSTNVVITGGGSIEMAAPSVEEEQSALEEMTTGSTGSAAMPPVSSVDVMWKDIVLQIPIKGGGFKTVLDNVGGTVESGTLTAIMGPTGSGKSSLLAVLAGRTLAVKGGVLTGTLLTNGNPRDPSAFKRISAFVLQDDLLFGYLTVKETLTLAAHFAIGTSMTAQEKQGLVQGVIKDLGLAKTINTIIGDDRARGVSGGERKRVSIGVELISNPCVLFLDEPTSGLDSFQALSVMSTLSKLAKSGRTVVASIHQPRSAIYALLDHLILISEGRTIYLGPADCASRHFQRQGNICPPLYNESDFFLDTISMDYRTAELEEITRKRITSLADAWRKDGLRASILEDGAPPTGPKGADLVQPMEKGGWLSNLYYLTWRAFSSAYRNLFAIAIRIILNLLFALMFSAIWHDVKHDQAGIQSLVGLLFMIGVNTAFSNCAAVINTFPNEKVIVVKEQASKSYPLSAYYLSKFFSELPVNLLGPCIFSTVIFWIVQFNHEPSRYGIFVVIVCIMALAGVALGTFISTLAPNIEVASALMPVFNIIFMIFSGILINVNSLPEGAKWVAKCSPIKWTINALALNEFKGATFSCTPGTRCLATGEDVLKAYSWDGEIGTSLLYVVIIMLVLLTLGYIVLRKSLPVYMKVVSSSPNK